MNPYLKNLSKIEFVVTEACTGRCKHCSAGDHAARGIDIDPQAAAEAVKRIVAAYPIQTVMTFGGEPLLHPTAVFAIMTATTACGVARRQVITNGYFSENPAYVRTVAAQLAACGVNDLLLSVDAFHQESIPLGAVMTFAEAVKDAGVPLRLSPAWLVSVEDRNPYNEKTREILACFGSMGVPVGEGNIVFPEGNARRYLADYFTETPPANPYVEDPRNVRCVSFSANGDVLDGNLYKQDIAEILQNYKP